MNARRKMGASFISAVAFAILTIILFSMVGDAKDTAQYVWDDDFRSEVDLLNFLGWIGLLITLADIVMGIVHAVEASVEEEEETSEKSASQPSASPLAAGSAVLCPRCGQMISIHADSCPFCGRKVCEGVPTEPEKPKDTGRKCIFCDTPMAQDQTFCGACGRRQD